MGGPSPGEWPLSAAATSMLRQPRTGAPELLRLAVRELVARGVIGARLGEPRRWRPTPVLLSPGNPVADLPRPLPLVAAALLPHLEAAGTDATTAVTAALGRRRALLTQLPNDTLAELVDRRLLHVERSRAFRVVPRRRVRRTPSGEAWAASLAMVGGSGAMPAVGLLLALDPAVARALREQDADLTGLHVDTALDDQLGSALDTAVAGSDDGGGGD